MPDVVTFGEAMLRLSPPGRLRLEQARTLEVWPAGAELNVAVGLARLGKDVAWVSRLPANPLGAIVLAHARSFGIDVSGVIQADEGRLGLYFVEISEPPLASRALYDRADSAFACLDPAELDWQALLAGARAFHVTGITSALSESCARAAADALRAARAAGCLTTYDLNVRTRLAPPAHWRERLESAAAFVDTLVCSVEDARAVLGLEGTPAEVAAAARERLGIGRVVVSRRVPDPSGMRRESVAVDGDGTAEAGLSPLPRQRADRRRRRLLRRADPRAPRRRRRAGARAGRRAGGRQAGSARRRTCRRPGGAGAGTCRRSEDAPVSRGWRLVRLEGPDGARLGALAPDDPGRIALLDGADPLALLDPGALARAAAASTEALEGVDAETLRPPAPWRLGLPVDCPEVWCAGVTYERSRDARLEESKTEARDAYGLVYDAERPELFLKDAQRRRTVGQDAPVGVRSDASWSVPEPELGLVLGEGGALLGLTVGNDVSSRDIEGENPLYLPQAKVYAGACAIGPAVLVPDDWEEPFPIELRIAAEGGRAPLRGGDLDGAHEARARRARGLLRPRQPGPARKRAPDRHGARASRRVHARGRAWWSRWASPESADW